MEDIVVLDDESNDGSDPHPASVAPNSSSHPKRVSVPNEAQPYVLLQCYETVTTDGTGQWYADCRYCKSDRQKMEKFGSTSNLRRHLTLLHKREYSRSGHIMSPRRSRLQEHTLEMLTFLRCNLRLVPIPKPVAETVAICFKK